MPDALHIALACPLEDRHFAWLRNISTRVELHDIFDLLKKERALLKAKQLDDTYYKTRELLDQILERTHVLVTWHLPSRLSERAPNLRWIQILSAGVEDVVRTTEFEEISATVTHAGGAASREIAEFVLTTILMFNKQMLIALRNQRQSLWQSPNLTTSELREKTVGILGLGNIGREVAALAKALGMNTIAIRRSGSRLEENIENCDLLYPTRDVSEIFRLSDFVVVCLPLTEETKNLIGRDLISLMKPTAYLINIARGAIVREEDLIDALQKGVIGGAALDVFKQEPLPPSSPFWGLPNVIVTSHISGNLDGYIDKVIGLVCEQLDRFMNGRPLWNVVSKDHGY